MSGDVTRRNSPMRLRIILVVVSEDRDHTGNMSWIIASQSETKGSGWNWEDNSDIHDDVITWKYFPRYLSFVVGNSTVTGEFPVQRPVTRSFDVFFNLRLNKQLSKQSKRWWFMMPSRSLWRHCNVVIFHHYRQCNQTIRDAKFPLGMKLSEIYLIFKTSDVLDTDEYIVF